MIKSLISSKGGGKFKQVWFVLRLTYTQNAYFNSTLFFDHMMFFDAHWDISNRFYSNDHFHWLYHFIIFDSFYKKVLKLPNFFHSNSRSEHKLQELLQKVATRGRFKPKTTKNRIKTVIFPLSRRVQGQDGCQNFINLSQNSYLMV